ncbi:MAG TPA: hypothetical protein VGM02_06700 [Acidobacteriaceae bacterium]
MAGAAISRTVLAQEMHGSSQTGVGSSIPAVTASQPRLRLWRMRQSLRPSLGLLAMSLTVSLGQAFCQPVTLTPPSGFSFAGYWQCSGSFEGSGRQHRSVYHGESSADGKWVDLTETDIEPKGYVGRYELGTDATRDKLVFIDMNSSGYAIFDSPGWDGRTLTVTSTDVLRYASAAPKNRFLYTVQDPQHFDVEWQYQKAGGWASGDLQHCAAQTPRLAVNYAPHAHAESMLSTIVRAFLESKPTLLLMVQLPF